MTIYQLSEEQYRSLLRGLGPNYTSLGYAMAIYGMAGMYGQSYIVRGTTERGRDQRARQAMDNNGAGALASVKTYRDGVEVTTDDPRIEARLREMGVQPAERSRDAAAAQGLMTPLPTHQRTTHFTRGLQDINMIAQRRMARSMSELIAETGGAGGDRERLQIDSQSLLRRMLSGSYQLNPEQYRHLMRRLGREGYSSRRSGGYSPLGQSEAIERGGEQRGTASVVYNDFTREMASVTIRTDDPLILQELSRMGIEPQGVQPTETTRREAPGR